MFKSTNYKFKSASWEFHLGIRTGKARAGILKARVGRLKARVDAINHESDSKHAI